jgi:hypothetical protein
MLNSDIRKAIVIAAAICGLSVTSFAQRGANAGKGKETAPVATPRTADGHPDLSGLWNGGGGGGGLNPTNAEYNDTDAKGFEAAIYATRGGGFTNFERDNTIVRRMGTNKPLYRPKYWDKVKQLDQDGNLADPAGNCMPPGVPRVGAPAQIIQTDKQLVFLYVAGGAAAFPATYRVIPIDGRAHTPLEDLDGSWNGESIGKWDGDTMVIDSIGFNSSTWLDIEGYIHSENMHVVERLTRDGNNLTWQATVEDPDMLLQPWAMNGRTLRLNTDPMALVPETPPCSERDYAHAMTKEHH